MYFLCSYWEQHEGNGLTRLTHTTHEQQLCQTQGKQIPVAKQSNTRVLIITSLLLPTSSLSPSNTWIYRVLQTWPPHLSTQNFRNCKPVQIISEFSELWKIWHLLKTCLLHSFQQIISIWTKILAEIGPKFQKLAAAFEVHKCVEHPVHPAPQHEPKFWTKLVQNSKNCRQHLRCTNVWNILKNQ